jgi:hypothetical protein
MAPARAAGRLRVVLRRAVVAAALVLTVLVADRGEHHAAGLLALGALGTLLLAAGMSRRAPAVVAAGAGLLGAEVLVRLGTAEAAPEGSVLLGAVLLVVVETAFLVAELRPEQVLERGALTARVRAVAAVAAGGLAIGAASLAAAVAGLGGSDALQGLGAAAALAVAALLVVSA